MIFPRVFIFKFDVVKPALVVQSRFPENPTVYIMKQDYFIPVRSQGGEVSEIKFCGFYTQSVKTDEKSGPRSYSTCVRSGKLFPLW